MRTKKLLYIGHLWPEPGSSAAGYRTLALLKALLGDTWPEDKINHQARWQIHFGCAAEQSDYAANLQALGIQQHRLKLNHDSFDHLLLQLQPEVVIYDRFISEEQFAPRVHEHCPKAINILDTQDLHFLRRARQKALSSGEPINLYGDDTIRELSSILRCDLTLIISDYELSLLTQTFQLNKTSLHYCPFMLSPDKPSAETEKTYEERAHFVMIGNFLHPPNKDAVYWCYQHLWPKIRQQLPEAELHIYGAYPPESIWQLNQPDKGFFIKGRARNAIDTLSQYRVNLAPLRFGAGIKGKIADGFLANTPCITTNIGQEGMQGNIEQWSWGGFSIDLNAADHEQRLVEKAVQLYQNKTLWQQCAENGIEFIRQHFNETEHAQRFLDKLHWLENNLPEHRQQNFIGRILKHQLFRSQYFMSKWIEEKNK
jgi:glycosyltransferase involved in cell wall biosynthesis